MLRHRERERERERQTDTKHIHKHIPIRSNSSLVSLTPTIEPQLTLNSFKKPTNNAIDIIFIIFTIFIIVEIVHNCQYRTEIQEFEITTSTDCMLFIVYSKPLSRDTYGLTKNKFCNVVKYTKKIFM